METLTPHQYETVLKYMEVANEESFDHAVTLLAQYDFNLNNLASKQERSFVRQSDSLQHHQVIKKYTQYLRVNQHSNSINIRLRTVCSKFNQHIRKISQQIFPCLYKTIFRTPFQKLYPETVIFYSVDLQQSLRKSTRISKPCLVIISGREFSQPINQFLNDDQDQTETDQFQIVGIVSNSQTNITFTQSPPCVFICRENIINEIQIIASFPISNNAIMGKLRQILPRVHQQFRRLQQIDNYIKNRDRDISLEMQTYDNPQQMETYDNPQQLLLGDEETSEGSRKTEYVRILEEQNELYRKMEQQARIARVKRQQEEILKNQELKREQELKEERTVRKMSIPDEPSTGEVVSLQFRCPDGRYIKRNFLKNQKIQLLYMWVQTNDDIFFQNQRDRLFELFISYPPISLTHHKQSTIQEVVQGNQENVIIRQS